MKSTKEIVVLTEAGQLEMAIARRMSYENKIFVADWKMDSLMDTIKTYSV